MDTPHIQITLFGKLTISYQKESIELTQAIGKQLITVFEMLVYYRNDKQFKEKIIEALWADNEHPANVMKFAIFRLRTYLKSIPFLSDLSLIVTGKDGYQLNPDYHYQIDCEQFIEKLEILEGKEVQKNMLGSVQSLLDIYAGDIYLCDGEHWAKQINVFYRSMYFEYVKKICTCYMQKEAYENIIPIVQKATNLFPQNEDAHYFYIKAYAQLGEYEKALQYYQTITKMFVDTYKLPISDRLQKLYHMILSNCDALIKIEDIQEHLCYAKQTEHAFYCEYEVFEYLYHVALRQQQRLKTPLYLILFHLSNCPKEQEMKAMNKLKKAISTTMRAADIFTKLNKMQYAALVYCETMKDVDVAAQRVLAQFSTYSNLKEISVTYVGKRI